jgi:hypothetical protein
LHPNHPNSFDSQFVVVFPGLQRAVSLATCYCVIRSPFVDRCRGRFIYHTRFQLPPDDLYAILRLRPATYTALILLLFLLLPLLPLIAGLRILRLGYAEVRPLLHSLHFVTGRQAERQGKILVAIGLLLSIPWLWSAAHVLRVLGF